MKEQDSLCPKSLDRRGFLTTAATALTASTVIAARDWTGKKPTRYPEPDVLVLDPAFAKYKLGNTPIRQLYTNPDMLWVEGPAWNGVGKYLLWSDIPNNVQMRWLEEDGHVSKFRHPSGNSNGNTFDWTGRQISCEHGNRRVVRYEYNGKITVLADGFDGKPFNAPNDAVVHPDGGIWFTDPGYGSLMNYEGTRFNTGSVQPHQKEAVYHIDAKTGKLTKVTEDIFKPNGLCFSPDYKKLYVADTGSSHYPQAKKEIKIWDVVNNTTLKNGKVFTSMNLEMEEKDANGLAQKVVKAGQADGIRCDEDGNIWSSAGWVGAGYDGVHVFEPKQGKRIGQILLPEICSNVCFGGTKRNRLFMTASQSLYAVYVETKGAHIT
jgi:gluconolactonase